MEETNIQNRIDNLEQKLDLILEYVSQQRLKSETTDDLITDLSLIGKDLYNTSVSELEKHSVEIDPAEVSRLLINLVKNIKNFNEILSLTESIIDLKKDAGPILNELIIELTGRLHTLEQKGYFEFMREAGNIIDKIVTGFTPDDLRRVGESIDVLVQTINNLSRTEILNDINNAVTAYDKTRRETVQPLSLWKAAREMNSPEIKPALGFMIALLKNLSEKKPNEQLKN